MAHEIIMPVLGMNQDTGTLLRWIRQAGDRVAKGDPVMEIATDKITVEIESPADGVLGGIAAAEGEEVPTGQVVALVLAEGETSPAAPPPAVTDVPHPAPAVPENVVEASPVARRLAEKHGIALRDVVPAGARVTRGDVEAHIARAAEKTTRVLASPKARRLARERGLQLERVTGSGPDGAVLAADVEAWTAEPVADASPKSTVRTPGRLWQVMAQRLTESWNTVPHFYLARTVDATQLRAWRESCRRRYERRVTLTDLVIKVLAASLREHPRLNASWRDGVITEYEDVNVGLAVAVEQGLLVPVIHEAQTRTVVEIAACRAQLVQAALEGELSITQMTGGTFSLTNLGMFGVERFSAIVNPPEAAILAVGAVRERAVAVKGAVEVRPTMEVTLSCDHRAVDGATAARFLDTLVQYMEAPLLLLD